MALGSKGEARSPAHGLYVSCLYVSSGCRALRPGDLHVAFSPWLGDKSSLAYC